MDIHGTSVLSFVTSLSTSSPRRAPKPVTNLSFEQGPALLRLLTFGADVASFVTVGSILVNLFELFYHPLIHATHLCVTMFAVMSIFFEATQMWAVRKCGGDKWPQTLKPLIAHDVSDDFHSAKSKVQERGSTLDCLRISEGCYQHLGCVYRSESR